MRAVVLYPGEDGYWVAECPSLPGCISQGSSKPETLANIRGHRGLVGDGRSPRAADP